MKQPLSGRLLFVLVFMFLTGSIFLLLQIGSSFFGTSRSASVDNDTIVLNKNELFSDIRTIVTIVLSFAGGFGILRRRSFGWICSVPVLLLLLGLSSAGWLYLINTPFNSSYILVPIVTFLLLYSITSMALKSTRKQFQISQRDYLFTSILTLILAILYFII